MPDPAAEEQSETQIAEAANACPVPMYNGRPCGRPIYTAPAGVDEKPICLMHSHDPSKDDGLFQKEFERILWGAGEGKADFTRFIFPAANYRAREFKPACIFFAATFMQDADFSCGSFALKADFSAVIFLQKAKFSSTKFMRAADFGEAKFTEGAQFSFAEFTKDASFLVAKFAQKAEFMGTIFRGPANFFMCTCSQGADFTLANFEKTADFRAAKFKRLADFGGATFSDKAEFGETVFECDAEEQILPVFSGARFKDPQLARFYRTSLNCALLHDCDVAEMTFSDIKWRKRENGKCMVFDEVVDLSYSWARSLCPDEESPDERNYGLIAELYQQLKKNYDDRRDYWTAGDFHYGEMEMKRLHSVRKNKLVRWLHRNLGLVAWYKYASEYGESYTRPLPWLVGILMLFMFLFPLCGLRRGDRSTAPEASAHKSRPLAEGQVPALSYTNFVHYGAAEPGGPQVTYWSLLGHSLMTTIEVAAFQRDLAYEPSYPWGRLLAILEILLTSTVVALFLLAVRRQFRR